ncbi:MAG: hypothetical protein WKF97_09910 [Chitinophagaceae bacterium]
MDQPLETLQDIKRIMEQSSRFISLSGWSGVSAGICALAGAWLATLKIDRYNSALTSYHDKSGSHYSGLEREGLTREIIYIAVIVFAVAFLSALFFTWTRSKKAGIPVWGRSARRLVWNTVLPMLAGGLVILRMMDQEDYMMITSCCLIFYGLALVNGSKYTLGEVRWLGYAQLILGVINLWMPDYGLVFWAAGFGVLHIIYGALMWWKYEKVNTTA